MSKTDNHAVIADPLHGFDGHVPDRSDPNIQYVVKPYAEFLTRFEPRVAKRTGPGRWETSRRRSPTDPTPHGIRLRLLQLTDERRAEHDAGVRRR